MRENKIHSAGYIYLRPKVTLHCLFIYFFRIFVSVYEKCLIPGKAQLRIRQATFRFLVS